MTTKQKLNLTYLAYILSIFIMPLMLVVLIFANKERKNQPKKWVKTHYSTLKRYTLLNLAWILSTIFIIWLAALVGPKTYIFFFFIGSCGLVWLWMFNLDQYFVLIVALAVERELGEPRYFLEMKTLFMMVTRFIVDKIDRRKVRKI